MKRPEELRESAKAFAQEQVEIMRQHGGEPNLTKRQMNGLINAAEKNLASVAGIRLRKTKREK